MYSKLIQEQNLYASFVGSEEWKAQVEAINSVNPAAADAVEQYGIGTLISDDGQYDFECGQLLDDMPGNIRYGKAVEEAYDAICDLANSYAQFVCSFDT